MDYEKRFKRLISDLWQVMKLHIHEWDKADKGIFDADEIIARLEKELGESSEPVVYSKDMKNV